MIDLRGDKEIEGLQRMLQGMRVRLGDRMSVFLDDQVADYLRDRIQKRFAMEGDDASGPWAPLRQNTRIIRGAGGETGPFRINYRTGALYDWIRTSTYRQGVLQMPATSGGRVMRDKLRTAQKGGFPRDKSGKPIVTSRPAPPRPVLAMSTRDVVAIRGMLGDWILAGEGRRSFA